jgi:hypothetical protein
LGVSKGIFVNKVKSTTDDDETICKAIQGMMTGTSCISFAPIAQEAHNAGRINLATRLLDFEPLPGNQVPLLLSMQQDEHALTKAVESGDSDLGISSN